MGMLEVIIKGGNQSWGEKSWEKMEKAESKQTRVLEMRELNVDEGLNSQVQGSSCVLRISGMKLPGEKHSYRTLYIGQGWRRHP